MSYQEPSQYNVFIPTHDATGDMVVGYSRNIKDWAWNRYGEIRPVTKSKGYFLRWKSEQAARVRNDDGRDWVWTEGADRPTGQDNLESFEFEGFTTVRFAPGFTLGRKSAQQAGWALQEAQTQAIGQQQMTLRVRKTFKALSLLTTNNKWEGNEANVDGSAGVLNGNSAILGNGNNWSNGTVANPYVKISLQFAVNKIIQATLGTIGEEDLVLVFSPDSAYAISQAQEIQSMLSNSIYALPNIEGGIRNQNANYGLPPRLYNIRVEVEKTVVITSRKGATTTTRAYAIPKGDAYLLTRREGDHVRDNEREDGDGKERNKENYFPVYSTIAGFFFEEFTIEAQDDPWNRRIQGSCVSDYDIQITSPKGAFHFGHCFG